MATAQSAAGPSRLSFAKVAASGTKDTALVNHSAKIAVPSIEHRRVSPSSPAAATLAPAAKAAASHPKTASPIFATKAAVSKAENVPPTQKKIPTESTATELARGVEKLGLSSSGTVAPSMPSLVVNGSAPSIDDVQSKNDAATAVSDDTSQRADSSSEVGTKAPSLDEKSITSGTTFALDEKESLRPDDSASVKAAAEDDEPTSIRGSQTVKVGSDVARVHRLRIGDMPERRIIRGLPESSDVGIVTPQSGLSGPQPSADIPQIVASVANTPDAFSSMYAQNPDEKLIEAMASSKDRIFLLRLEHDVIDFVQSSTEPYMDLPPNNSFCRMLTHKLADYYHMTHSFEAVQGAVRIYRTPFCRVPPSLASIVGNAVESQPESAAPVMLPKKIMRRGEDFGQASNSPSKGTSEVGSDGKDKSGASKGKLTREEREEAYDKARERIFGNSEKTGESTPDNEEGVSRASSVSAKEKTNQGKRGKTGKQRRDDSDSWDSRSNYQVFYGTPHGANWSPQYVPLGGQQFSGPVQPPYQTPMPQAFTQQGAGYPQLMPQGAANTYSQFGPVPTTFAPQPSQSGGPLRYPLSNNVMQGYGAPIQSSQAPQGWYNQQAPGFVGQHNGYAPQQAAFNSQQQQVGYNQVASPAVSTQQPTRLSQSQSSQTNSATSNGIPYAFGQLPAHMNPHDPKSQHPIPGSYNRHAFNPQTQSFVPGNGMSPGQHTLPAYNLSGPPHGSPQITTAPAYGTYSSSPGMQQPFMAGPHTYGMSRQSSGSSIPSYHPHGMSPQHLGQHSGPHQPPMHPHMSSPIPSQHMGHPSQIKGAPGLPAMGNGGHQQHGAPHGFTSLPNYGNPASLPQKPPSGI